MFRPSRRHLLGGLGASGLVGCAGRAVGRGADTGAGAVGETPAARGFTLPAEWEAHAGCLMQFPPALNYCGSGTGCSYLDQARLDWSATAEAVSRFEPVAMYVTPEDRATAETLCGDFVTLVEAPLSDGWSRDTGPLVLCDGAGAMAAACFAFNGWGGSMAYADDALVKWEMAAALGLETFDHPMVLEGGAVIVDGAGTLITTEECLLHETRNPDLSREAQEQILRDYLGVEQIVWVENGWVPDPLTNGHIDGIAAFVAPGVVLLNTLSDSSDPNSAILRAAREVIEAAGIEVIGLPATSWTAFHINFYQANGAVIVPIEGRASVDDTPLGIIADAHPGLEVVGVEAPTLGTAGGGIHCITQQVPEGVDWPW